MASPVYVQLSQISNRLDLYVLPAILVFGNLANVFNIHIFLRRKMRVNTCSWYFVCLSLAHLLLLNASCLTRVVTAWTKYEYATNNPAYCKVRSYLFNLSLLLSRQFITLISIDRWLVTSSNPWLRRQSSLKVTRWLIIGSVSFWSAYNVHVLIGYQANPSGCYPPPGNAYAPFASMDAVVTTILPLVSMIVFSFLSLHNLRSNVVHQILPSTMHQVKAGVSGRAPRPKRNRQLMRLSLVQVLVFVVLNSGWTTFALFVLLAKPATFGALNLQLITIFVNSIGFTLLYIYGATTFVVYTMASKTFRSECMLTCTRSWMQAKQWLHNI